jgi:LacI family transcriptional regulator
VIDVARLAGVGTTTVSAVVHGREHVAPELRERVLEAIEQLSYQPNVSARNLRLQRTDVIGLVVGDLLDPYNAELTAHVERCAARSGLKVLLATSGEDELTYADVVSVDVVRGLMGHPVAAVLLVGTAGPPDLAKLADSHVPLVFVDARNGQLGPSVEVDNVLGGELATSHLIGLGHRRIAYVSGVGFGPMTEAEDEARLAGYTSALERVEGKAVKHRELQLGSIARKERQAALTALLALPQRPTGIFAASDTTALELMQRAHELGLRVPADLSIVGFDNISLAGYELIALTTVGVPIQELARRAVDVVMDTLDGGASAGAVLLEPELIIRRSTAAPAKVAKAKRRVSP